MHHRYRDFKKSLKQVNDGKSNDAARQAVESLISVGVTSTFFISFCPL